MALGSRTYAYELVQGWGTLPAGWELVDVVGVRASSRDLIYVFNRGTHPIVIFDLAGNVVGHWGDGAFHRPHGLQIGPDDTIYCVDDLGCTVQAFTPEGKRLFTLGTPDQESDTGWSGSYDTLAGGPPFNRPTNLAVGANGDLYVSDGYQNCKTHRFSADPAGGAPRLVQSWGSAGRGPGQFRLPHGACAEPEGTILIGDRMNDRVQRFAATGEYLAEWSDVRQPDDIYRDRDGIYYIAELGHQDGVVGNLGSRVTVRDASGAILSSWGDQGDPAAPGNVAAAHGICTDARGDVYLGEVTHTARISRGLVPPGTHVLQKFRRLS